MTVEEYLQGMSETIIRKWNGLGYTKQIIFTFRYNERIGLVIALVRNEKDEWKYCVYSNDSSVVECEEDETRAFCSETYKGYLRFIPRYPGSSVRTVA